LLLLCCCFTDVTCDVNGATPLDLARCAEVCADSGAADFKAESVESYLPTLLVPTLLPTLLVCR
jgi:hypothetical protein